jgi:hypothetical protein
MVVKTFETKISDIHDNFGKKKIVLIESHQAEIDSLNSEYLSSKDHFKRIEQEISTCLFQSSVLEFSPHIISSIH